jgi:hypothetical protein
MQYFMTFLEIFLAILLVAEIGIQIKKMKNRKNKKNNKNKQIVQTEKNAQNTQNTQKSQNLQNANQNAEPAIVREVKEEKILISTDVAPFCPMGAEPQPLSIDDLRSEAAIYMRYGHYAQAATVLRWYVDMNPNDREAINQLLDAYLALADMDAYTSILSTLGENMDFHAQDAEWLRERLYTGLRNDPGNLELLVLAERSGLPIPVAGDNHENLVTMTTAAALALVSRNPDPAYGASILRRAILNDPLRLPLHAELLRITHQQKDMEKYGDALVLLYLCVGNGAKTLRDRMLRAGMSLGACPLWDILSSWNGDMLELVDVARERNIIIPAALNIS